MSAPDSATSESRFSKECPTPKITDISKGSPFFFNAQGAKIMQWVVGNDCIRHEEVENAKNNTAENNVLAIHPNPFKCKKFITMLSIGILLTLAIVILTAVLIILRRKRKLCYIGPTQIIALGALDILLILAALLLGFSSAVLVWNNEKLGRSVKQTDIAERMDLHADTVLCQIRKNYVAPERVDKSQLRTALEQGFFNAIQGKNESTQWRKVIKDIIDSKIEIAGTNDSTVIDKVRKYVEHEVTPADMFGAVYYGNETGNRTADPTAHFEAFRNAVYKLFGIVSYDLAFNKRSEVFRPRRHITAFHTFSWMAVFSAVLILVVFLLIRVTLILRTTQSSNLSKSSSTSTRSSQMHRIEFAILRVPNLFAATISLFGAVMISFYVWGVYEGYFFMCYSSLDPKTFYPNHKVELQKDLNYALEVNEFIERCDQGYNFIEAFGKNFLIEPRLMETYGANFSEPDDPIPEKLLVMNIERYESNVEQLKKNVTELTKELRSIMKPGHGFAVRDLMIASTHLAAMEQSPRELDLDDGFRDRYRHEVAKLTNAKVNTSFGESIKSALAIVEVIPHYCYDISAIWSRLGGVDQDFNTPVQGQWLFCVIIGLLCLFIFIVTLFLSDSSDIVHSSVTSPRTRSYAGQVARSGSDCRLLSASENLSNQPEGQSASEVVPQNTQQISVPNQQSSTPKGQDDMSVQQQNIPSSTPKGQDDMSVQQQNIPNQPDNVPIQNADAHETTKTSYEVAATTEEDKKTTIKEKNEKEKEKEKGKPNEKEKEKEKEKPNEISKANKT